MSPKSYHFRDSPWCKKLHQLFDVVFLRFPRTHRLMTQSRTGAGKSNTCSIRGDWKHKTWECKAWNCRAWKQDMNLQEVNMKIARGENAPRKNAGRAIAALKNAGHKNRRNETIAYWLWSYRVLVATLSFGVARYVDLYLKPYDSNVFLLHSLRLPGY